MSKSILNTCLAFICLAAYTTTSHAVEFIPFNGHEGYQEIKISDDTYYVGFHGYREAPTDQVLLAWEIRSAQLCAQTGSTMFVELAYLFEPLTKNERDAFSAIDGAPQYMHTSGYVYIPIYIPSGPRYIELHAPSKMAAVRCIHSAEELLDKKRAINISDKLRELSQFTTSGKKD